MTYNLRRLSMQGLIQKIPHTYRYQVTDRGLTDAMFLSAVHDRLLPTGLAELHTNFPAPIRAARAPTSRRSTNALAERFSLHDQPHQPPRSKT